MSCWCADPGKFATWSSDAWGGTPSGAAHAQAYPSQNSNQPWPEFGWEGSKRLFVSAFCSSSRSESNCSRRRRLLWDPRLLPVSSPLAITVGSREAENDALVKSGVVPSSSQGLLTCVLTSLFLFLNVGFLYRVNE